MQYNESALAVINSRVEGYIEKLYVDFTGVQVKKGDHLVEIYSPDLVLAQKELLVGLEGPANNALIEASKLKLLRWGLTQEQVDDLVQKRKVSERVTLFSPINGTVTERMAVQQAHSLFGIEPVGDGLEARLFNPTTRTVRARLSTPDWPEGVERPGRVTPVNCEHLPVGETLPVVDGEVKVELRAKQILTLLIE